MGGIFNFNYFIMQLEEQFKGVLWNKTHDAKCAKIAENFAIGFAMWIQGNAYKESAWRMWGKGDSKFTIEQLLEIYKKIL